MFSRMARIRGRCAHTPTSTSKGTASTAIQAKGPPIRPIRARNSKIKGMSTSITMEAEDMKSRSDSKSRMELAKMPIDWGRCSSRMAMISRSSVAFRLRSALRPARSTKRALSQRMPNSSTMASVVPRARVHSEV